MARHDSLAEGFLAAAAERPDATAMELGQRHLTYNALARMSGAVAAAIEEHEGSNPTGLAGVLASRSLSAFAGTLGVLVSGRGHVPFGPSLPPARTRQVFPRTGVRSLVVGREGLVALEALLPAVEDPLLVLSPEIDNFGPLRERHPRHRFMAAAELEAAEAVPPVPSVRPDDICYLVFTSGSTGIPKAVPVSHRNILAYMASIPDRMRILPSDRTSQTFDLTFDLSLHDMFTTWWSGACLCTMPEQALLAPATYISRNRLTVWYSVPSVAMIMARLHLLRPGSFPSLRLSQFVGEPLPLRTVQMWLDAAPSSTVENLYGPTETTMVISAFQWQGGAAEERHRNAIVPIGSVFRGQRGAIVTEDGSVSLDGAARGELHLPGPQVAQGYWNDPERTAESFVRLPGDEETWYRTGDLVERDDDGTLHFVGRVDNQIKLHGNRIELQEIDAALREAAGVDMAVAVAWPVRPEGVGGIVGFVAASAPLDMRVLKAELAKRLPRHMLPSHILQLPELPLNANRKIDRRALTAHLDAKWPEGIVPPGSQGP